MPTSPVIRRVASLLLAIAAALGCCQQSSLAAEPMIELTLQGKKLEGVPIHWDQQEVHLLGRDGRLLDFEPSEATDFKKIASEFRPYSASEFRAALLRELGEDYEVTGTSHYLVAHPRGQGDQWAERFEDLYRSFVHYFSVRGLTPVTPRFSLVGIVCKNREDFARHAAAQGNGAVPNDVQGYYDRTSNRILLYDMGGKADSQNWRRTASVLIHETTHQTAFNTGIHSRYCKPPIWLVEGLAMLFEAPGVYDSQSHPQPGDRVNRERLRTFQQAIAPQHRPEMIASLAASDDLFRVNPDVAYAEAWAMSFFLVETEPQKYAQYLKRTASRPPFQEYAAADRTADFTAIFGDDWRMLEARFLRFMAALR